MEKEKGTKRTMSSSTSGPSTSASSSSHQTPGTSTAVASTSSAAGKREARKTSGDAGAEGGTGAPGETPAAGGGDGPPPRKMYKVMFEPRRIAAISNLEDLDLIITRFQNNKIRQRIDARAKEENDLRLRIEQLEKRQTQDDAVLNVVNRHWNLLNEDVRIMLQRFDTETSDELESNNENEATTSFMSEMSKWDQEELDEKLAKKVQVSTRAVTKMVQAFDRLFQRNEKLSAVLKGDIGPGEASGDEGAAPPPAETVLPDLDEDVKEEYIGLLEENKKVQLQNTTLHAKYRTMSLKMKELAEKLMGEDTQIDELKNRVSDLDYELDDLSVECKKKCESLVMWADKVTELEEQLEKTSMSETADKDMWTSGEIATLQKEHEELTDLAEERRKELETLKQQHITTLQEIDKLNKEIHSIPEQTVMETTEYKCLQSKFSVVYHESKLLKEVIQDVQKNVFNVQNAQQAQLKQMEKEEADVQKILQGDMVNLEETLAHLKKEYEMLRQEFEKNAAANEQVAPVHKEMRNLITQLQDHNKQVKQEAQRLRQKCIQGQEENTKMKKYNVEQFQKLERLHSGKREKRSSGEAPQLQQSGTITAARVAEAVALAAVKSEVEVKPEAAATTSTTTSASEKGKEDKPGETSKVKEAEIKIEVKEDVSATESAAVTTTSSVEPTTTVVTTTTTATVTSTSTTGAPETKVKQEPVESVPPATTDTPVPVKAEGVTTPLLPLKIELVVKDEPQPGPSSAITTMPPPSTPGTSTGGPTGPPAPKKISEAEQAQIQELKSQVKKINAETKEMKLLLDMYKGQNKEQTDRVELMVNERKAKIELEERKQELKRLQENLKKEEKKKVAEEDLSAKIKSLEDRTTGLKRQIAAQKQEEEALLNEMDVTGQAFEDMQEQNSRLIQQLREKENANFKLMSDRIKANRVQELLKEEKEAQQRNNQIIMEHLQHKTTVIKKLEEIENQLVTTISIMEKEAMVRQQAMELNKRKAIESAQSAADLKLHLEKYHSQMKEAQQLVAEKTSALAAEAFKSKRYVEEHSILAARLERLKKIEMSGNTDEVLMAEMQEYKDMLTCPSCKVRRKDAVLTKCFHVFCFDCLRTRYETRQRKCPRCNAAFGANDYHRLYLS